MKRKSISADVTRVLIAKSGGYCQNPGCSTNLVPFFRDGTVTNIHELAHIIAQSPHGPRGSATLSISDRDNYENLILLCPTCHTLIDKNPGQYPEILLEEWKATHEQRIQLLFDSRLYGNRNELFAVVSEIMRENKSIYDTYGPESPESADPFSDAARMWRQSVLTIIIPNNQKVLSLLIRNGCLLHEDEKAIVDEFRVHKLGVEFNHLSGDKNGRVPRFPPGMQRFLRGADV